MLMTHTHTYISSKNWQVSLHPPLDEDRAVARERRRVARGDGKDGILTLDNLTKVYGHNSCCSGGVPDKIAVNQLCLIMRKAEVSSECFFLYYLSSKDLSDIKIIASVHL